MRLSLDIVDVSHQRSFTKVPIRSAELEVTVQTRGLDHVREIVASLIAAGYPASPTDPELVALIGPAAPAAGTRRRARSGTDRD